MSADPEVRALSKAIFTMAKTASLVALAGEATALALGGYFAVVRAQEWKAIPVLAFLALVTFFLRGLTDDWKERANEQLRRLDLADGLGRSISRRDCADLLANAPPLANWVARRHSGTEAYFATADAGSPLRLVQNLRESAWWTSQLGRDAEKLQRIWIFTFGTLGVLILALSAMRAGTPSTFLAAPSFAIAVLLFLFTSGPYRRLREFRALHEAAGRVEIQAGHLLAGRAPVTEADALLLASEYHLARKGAPLLPAFLWQMRRATLNALWDGVVRERAGDASA